MPLRAQPTGDFSAAVTLGKPTSVEQQAVVKSHGDERKRWIKAITDEIEGLRRTNTMRPATPGEVREFRSKGDPVAPSKMVFVIKPGKEAGTLKHKARLVVCGNFRPQVAMT